MIANAVGDRRYRDLVDLIAGIERDDGWSTALEFLMKAQTQKYSSPIIIGQDKTNMEPLKYREMVFELLSCSGLEPVRPDTSTLLKDLESEPSLVDASNTFLLRLDELVLDQIQSGDTLFFDLSNNTTLSQRTLETLDRIRSENLQETVLQRKENLINIEPLWFCEYSRLALSSLSIKGTRIDSEILDTVLSIIQTPKISKTRINDVSAISNLDEDTLTRPSNTLYRKLHSHLINHEVKELSLLASRHSVPLLSSLLDDAFSAYLDTTSTAGYKVLLDLINAHIAVRDVESILVLEKLAQMKNSRIATTAILAIGNFYHESSATVLVKLLCTSKNEEIQQAVAKAIENVYKKCPEADQIIVSSLDTECRNRGRLKKLYRRLSKEKPLYYQ